MWPAGKGGNKASLNCQNIAGAAYYSCSKYGVGKQRSCCGFAGDFYGVKCLCIPCYVDTFASVGVVCLAALLMLNRPTAELTTPLPEVISKSPDQIAGSAVIELKPLHQPILPEIKPRKLNHCGLHPPFPPQMR
jgi:hypothetical protein